jgi:rhamnogalacturonyl hydrolase YesR
MTSLTTGILVICVVPAFVLTACCREATAPVAQPDVFAPDFIEASMERAFTWQIGNIVYEAPLPDGGFQEVSDTEWVRGAFFAGVMAAHEATGDPRFLEAAIDIGERNDWRPGPRPRHADDHCIAQTYARVFLIEREQRMIAPIIERFEQMIAEPRPGPVVGWTEDDNWSWCDALFMAPPTMALVAEATGDQRYLDLMSTMWW